MGKPQACRKKSTVNRLDKPVKKAKTKIPLLEHFAATGRVAQRHARCTFVGSSQVMRASTSEKAGPPEFPGLIAASI